MRRALIVGLMGLVLLAASAWAGFRLAARIAPERLRVETERRLSSLLDAPVQIDQTRLSLGWGLILEARGVEVEPGGAAGRLRVERALARLDPVALLMARFRLDWLALEGARFRIALPARASGRSGEYDLRDTVEALDRAARSLLEKWPPIRKLEIRSGTILFADSALDEPLAIRIEEVSGEARRASFRRRTELRIQARIRDPEGRGGTIALRAEADGRIRATLTLERMDLAILAPYASQLGVASGLGGEAEGTVGWQHQPGRPHHLDIRLEVSGLRASLLRGEEKSPFAIALDRSALAARIEARPDVLRLEEAEISDGQVTLRAEGSLALPVERRADLRLAVQLLELPLLRLREALAYLSPEIRAWLEPLSDRVEAGRLLELRVEARTTVAGFRELVESRLRSRPGEITVRAEIADAGLRIGADDRHLEAVSGSAIWSGDVLELRDVRGRLGTRSLPKLDATVRGLAQIHSLDEVNCIPPPSKISLPGTRGLRDWIGARHREGAEPAWKRLSIDADWILHPALLCSLEHAFGEISSAPDGLDFTVGHGVWAGIPVRGAGSYRRVPEESLALELSLGPPFEPMWLEPAPDPWAKGRWEIEASRLGDWRIRGGSGRFRISGSTLRLEDSTLLLAPLGEVEGNAEIALGSEAELPFRIEGQMRKMDLLDLTASSGLEEELLSGRLVGAGVLTGRLHEGLPFLTDAEGVLSLHAREGKIHQELPLFVAITVASDRFDPFRSREELPYTAIDLVARIQGGQVHSETLSLDAPSLKMVGSGQVGAVPPHDAEAVLGLFLFPTLDALINRVPVLNRVILGRDENFLGAYFAITGTWKEPKARLIPVKSFAEGPAHFMLEGPEFIWNGLKRLESLLNPSSGAPTATEEPEPTP